MIKLQSGYYRYSLKDGITFVNHRYPNLFESSILLSPSSFASIVKANMPEGIYYSFFKTTSETLADLHFQYDIGGLCDY